MTALKGIVRGATVVLDQSVPAMDGKRVLVLLDASDEVVLPNAEQAALWKQWVESPLQGPIEDDNEPSFP
jgi:hypothetical protein